MKTKFFILGMALAYTAMCALVGCSKSSNDETLVLDIRGNTAFVNWTDTCNGGYWNHTYDDSITSIRFGEFIFSHLPAGPGAAFGPNGCPGMYWDGFTTGSNGDSADYGQGGSSQGWVAHQWGVIAGGGIDTIINGVPSVVKGVPYLLAYWGYHMEPEWWFMHFGDIPPVPMHCLTAGLADGSPFAPQEVWICSHPWPYYGNIHGDGFAKPVKETQKPFVLNITGLDVDSFDILIVVRDTLAFYDPTAPDSVRQKDDWHPVNLQSLEGGIKTLYITMDVPDTSPEWGPNTAVYFCLDKLKVIKQEAATSGTVAQKAKARTAQPSAKGLMEITDYFPLTSYTGGDLSVYDHKGKEVLKTTVKAGEKPNLSKLPEGKYLLRHGHKHIPFKKVK